MTIDNNPKACRSMIWQRLEVCLQYANDAVITGRSNSNRNPPRRKVNTSSSGICISFIALLPSELFEEAIKSINFEIGPRAIFNLIVMITNDDGDGFNLRKKVGSNDLIKAFKVITSKTNVVKMTSQNNSPLHFGALLGLKWCEGLEQILLADHDALGKSDELTGFVPFIAAASGLSKDDYDDYLSVIAK